MVQTSLLPNEAGVVETQVVEQPTFTSFATTYPEGLVYWRVAAMVEGRRPSASRRPGAAWQSFVKRSPGTDPGQRRATAPPWVRT